MRESEEPATKTTAKARCARCGRPEGDFGHEYRERGWVGAGLHPFVPPANEVPA